jgi:DNA polymerase-3 subunit delta'
MNKYFDEIIGNDQVKEIFNSMLNSSDIPHAFLFTGPEGVGKENAAIVFAKAINFSESDFQNGHKKITQIQNLSEPYIKYILSLPRGKNETDQNDPYEKLSVDEIEAIKIELEKKEQI